MTPSAKCETLIKSFEQCRLHSYMPTSHDKPTIGWGTTGADIHLGMTWTQEQADARFHTDLARFAAAVDGMVSHTVTNQNQFDAMVSFAYNEGAEALRTSILLAHHNKGDHAGAAPYFMHYTTQAHIVLGGLVRRRKEEMGLYLA